jgi:hypothetical protein
MDDLYREILVKRSSTGKDKALKYLVIAVTALVIVAGILFFPPLILGGIVLGILDYYFVLPNFDLEYEYLYVNGDIDVDKIMSRQKRKKAASFDLAELEICAPTGSHELDSYLSGGNAKIADYTSGEENVKSWTVICNHNGERTGAMLELDETVIGDLWRRAPRKVIKY